jgi:hypothetical protein
MRNAGRTTTPDWRVDVLPTPSTPSCSAPTDGDGEPPPF